MVSRSYVPAYLFLYVAAGLSMSCIYSKLAGYPSPIMPTINWRMEKGTELPGSSGHRSHDYTVVLLVHPFYVALSRCWHICLRLCLANSRLETRSRSRDEWCFSSHLRGVRDWTDSTQRMKWPTDLLTACWIRWLQSMINRAERERAIVDGSPFWIMLSV